MTPALETSGPPRLRPYQREAAGAILRAALRREGGPVSVQIARQGGKNELSAQVEVQLLTRSAHVARSIVKCAPTFRPQALISLERARRRFRDSGLGPWTSVEGGNTLRLGLARVVFLSAAPESKVVGHTADLLLEVDEAQDVEEEKFEKEFRPMAASTGAPSVFYGTPWDDFCLLERAKQHCLELERRDGVRRHFEFDWQVVGSYNPAYADFAREQMAYLGAAHPLFLTQYCLQPLPGAGRLLSATQLSLLRGSHAWLDAPLPGDVYVAGLDLGGEAAPDSPAGSRHDSTALTLARLLPAGSGVPFVQSQLEVVRVYTWTGEAHASLHGALASLLGQTWRVSKVVVDATGLGEPVAAYLKAALGSRVEARKLSAQAKSALGFELLAAVNGGRLRLPGSGPPELAELHRQLSLCRAVYRANKTMNFYVDERDGHDDAVVSLALAVAAAADAGPRRAVGRAAED
ncbi:MAG TPA: hypothetical protein VNN10_13770 [Dehalococcoidia bacterium]|nr:hypothetical protein [Dehalococcoidia bacterium]